MDKRRQFSLAGVCHKHVSIQELWAYFHPNVPKAPTRANPKMTPKNVPTLDPFFFDFSCLCSSGTSTTAVVGASSAGASVDSVVGAADACVDGVEVVVLVVVVLPDGHAPTPIPGFLIGWVLFAA